MVITLDRPLLSGLALLLHRAADILQIRWVTGPQDIIRGQNRDIGNNHAELFAKHQIRGVRGLVVIEEHELDLLDLAAGEQLVQRLVTSTDDNADKVPQASQLDQHVGDGGIFRVQFQTEIALAASSPDGIAEQYGRVAYVAAQFDHCMWLEFSNEIGDDLAFGSSHIHETIFLFELVDEIQNPLRVASDLIDVGLFVDEVQELKLFSALVLYID